MTAKLKAVTAVSSPWKEAKLSINGKKVGWGEELVLLRGQENEVTVEVPSAIARALNLALPENGGLNIDASPKFDSWVAPVNGEFNWKITPDAGKSGRITLAFYSREVDQLWMHQSLVISSNLADEVTVLMDGIEIPSNGTNIPAGGTTKLSLAYKSPDLIRGLKLALDVVFEEDLVPGDLTSQPPLLEQTVNHDWMITAAENKIGTFKLKLLTEEEQAVLYTPVVRIKKNLDINFTFKVKGESAPVPPEEYVVADDQLMFAAWVVLKKPDGSPLRGISVTISQTYWEDQTVETKDNGEAYFFVIPRESVDEDTLAKIVAVAQFPEGEAVAEMWVRGYASI